MPQERKIKIGIFADDIDRRGMGTAVVLQQLVRELLGGFSGEAEIVLVYKDGGCRHELCDIARRVPVRILPLPKFAGFFSYAWFFASTRERFDVVHFPRPALHPLFWLLKVFGKTKRIVVTFHGAPEGKHVPIYETFYTKFNRRFISFLGQYFIDIAIADSRAAVEQIANYYRIPEHKIHPVYLGVGADYRPLAPEERVAAAERLKEKYGVKSPYILTVGRLDPHKNIYRLIEAFFALKKREQIPHRLVIVGGRHEPEYTARVESLINSSPFGNDVQIAPFIEEADLPAAYGCADVFVFISLSEGFGLPLVEAMACGTPSVASNISCLPEIAGGAVELADPYDILDVAGKIKNIIKGAEFREELIKKGLARSKVFDWSKMAAGIYRIYKS